MSNLKSLTFTVLPNKSVDPAVRRREKLIEKLNEQLKLVRNPNFKITFNRWETNDAGGTCRRRENETHQTLVVH